ncbi:hypothetical protein RND71_001456 [Anisodus tanguticus]|uniref:Uncharacterized protein n=1 Tax=Anisodus tanguticus TaxID=243964 RepID=A0AAE1T0Y6_9SOLA|nr:hypothetical protein RND71_001456 [Anisodus tanguticus]
MKGIFWKTNPELGEDFDGSVSCKNEPFLVILASPIRPRFGSKWAIEHGSKFKRRSSARVYNVGIIQYKKLSIWLSLGFDGSWILSKGKVGLSIATGTVDDCVMWGQHHC